MALPAFSWHIPTSLLRKILYKQGSITLATGNSSKHNNTESTSSPSTLFLKLLADNKIKNYCCAVFFIPLKSWSFYCPLLTTNLN
ncbi:MAG: hypothetical protein K0A99_00935 [Desulfoarculaceae bacterium]|nr:hypothetical protein [Desulfoarculaceae bacterium]